MSNLSAENGSGFSISGNAIAENSSVFLGDRHERSTLRYLATLDAEVDLERFLNIKGGTLFAQVLSAHGHNNPRGNGAGDFQVFSNIENDEEFHELFELWYQQEFFDGTFRLKIGKIDANSEFFYLDSAANVTNSSAGFGPTAFTTPSFPNSAFSFNAFASWQAFGGLNFTLGYGLYDGSAAVDGIPTGRRLVGEFFSSDRSDALFHVLEQRVNWGSGTAVTTGWFNSGDFETVSGISTRDTFGFNAGIEQGVGDATVFLQYGWAEQDISEATHHAAAGVIYKLAKLGRPKDSVGTYFSWVDLNDRAGFSRNEAALELYYNFQLNEQIIIRPNIQHIWNPGGKPGPDATAISLRVELSF